jgi:uncharacterized protein YoaH (UPF0181 family)
MTDEARIERLTELARRVWPMLINVRVVRDPIGHEAAVLHDVLGGGHSLSPQVLRISHPRALEALEAALLVLAGEPPGVEQLAEEWDARAKEAMGTGASSGVYRAGAISICAQELRERAKGKP